MFNQNALSIAKISVGNKRNFNCKFVTKSNQRYEMNWLNQQNLQTHPMQIKPTGMA